MSAEAEIHRSSVTQSSFKEPTSFKDEKLANSVVEGLSITLQVETNGKETDTAASSEKPRIEIAQFSSSPTKASYHKGSISRTGMSRSGTTPVIVPLNDLSTTDSQSKKNSSPRLLRASESDISGAVSSARIMLSPMDTPTAEDSDKRPLQSIKQRLQSIKGDGEVLVGTPVKEGHQNYMLMYDMLTGIRISVSRCNAKPAREMDPSDFTAAHKLAFDVTGIRS
jgi:hypothetical protein